MNKCHMHSLKNTHIISKLLDKNFITKHSDSYKRHNKNNASMKSLATYFPQWFPVIAVQKLNEFGQEK